MDKRYFYRILGLSENATTAQIKEAYEKKLHKLRSEDYADDPEYVARKTREVKNAYSVLTGGAAPATRTQREARFEKWKDAQEEEAEEKGSRAFQQASAKSGSNRKKTYFAPNERGAQQNSQKRLVNKIVLGVVILFIGSGVLGSCVELISNVVSDVTYDYNYSLPEEDSPESIWEQVDQLQANADQFDYESFLDLSSCEANADRVEWEASDETADAIWGDMTDLAWYLGLHDNAEALAYITGEEDFYWENDDLTNALMMASVMNPPDFEAVAGGKNLYSGESILDYDSYLRFLQDIAENQIDQVAPVRE